MLENQIDQHERRAVMRNEQRVREEQQRVFAQDQSLPCQATTMHTFAQADAQTPRGRFTQVDAATVVGANPIIDYPAGPAWCADPGSQCVEPPLGLDNPALEPSTVFHASSVEHLGEPPSASPLGNVGSPALSRGFDPQMASAGSTGPAEAPTTSSPGSLFEPAGSRFRRRV